MDISVKSFKRRFLFEKVAIFGTALAGMAGGYWLLSARLLPASDPELPIALLPGSMGLYDVIVTLILGSVIYGALTFFSRPVGAMAALLAGLTGICMASPLPERLWWSSDLPRWAIYAKLLSSLLVLAVAVSVGQWIIRRVRRRVEKHAGQWAWGGLTPPLRGASHGKKYYQDVALFTGVSALAGLIVAAILMASSLRGQVLFALFAGFLVSTLLSIHFLQQSGHWRIWLAPVLGGCGVYLLGAAGIGGHPMFQTLPIDWIAAGGAGAVSAEWFYLRVCDVHAMEQKQQAAGIIE